MSIENTTTVDFVNVQSATGEVLLTISDHLDWDEQEGRHLELLQSKLNTYLRFIESGELYRTFPQTKGRNLVIDVAGQFPMSTIGRSFFQKAERAVRNAGYSIRFRLLDSKNIVH